MKKTMEVALATVILALCLTKAAGAPLAGTWEGTIHGQKALTVTMEGAPEHWRGTLVMYVADSKFGEPGAHIVGQIEHTLTNIKGDGKSLRFSVEGADVDYEMTLTGEGRALLLQHAHGDTPEVTVPLQRR